METPLDIGDYVMFRRRFKPKEFAIFKVVNNYDDLSYDAICLFSCSHYRKDSDVYFEKAAHCEGQNRCTELTYKLDHNHPFLILHAK